MNIRVNPSERYYFYAMVCISVLIYFLTVFIFALYAGLLMVGGLLLSSLLIGHLRNNAIKLSERQFPAVYEIVESHCKKLGLTKIPEIYLLQGNGMLNAFATRFAGRNFVVLYSDVFEVAYQEGLDAVSFIMGHELGHIKRNHTSALKNALILPAKFIPFLGNAYSRACELTCDNIGHALNPQGAGRGLLILAAGKKLFSMVDVEDFIQYQDERGFSGAFAELFSTHPPLIKRVAAVNKRNQENLVLEKPFFASPKVDDSKETQV